MLRYAILGHYRPWLRKTAESGYISCQAARKVWEAFGIEDRMGFSIEDNHMHCMVPPSQYPEIEAFLDKFLLGKMNIDTHVTKAEQCNFHRFAPIF